MPGSAFIIVEHRRDCRVCAPSLDGVSRVVDRRADQWVQKSEHPAVERDESGRLRGLELREREIELLERRPQDVELADV